MLQGEKIVNYLGWSRTWVCAFVAFFVAAMAASAPANTLTIGWSGAAGVYSGGGTGLPASAWLTAVFSDTGTDKVDLTLTANFPSGSPLDVDQVDFNILDSLDSLLPNLKFTAAASNASTVTMTASTDNGQTAGPAKGFDVQFGSGQGSNALGSGGGAQIDVIHLSLTSGTGLNALDFNAQSTPGNNGFGPFYAAAHVQNTGTNGQDSAWVSSTGTPTVGGPLPTPAPASIWSGACLLLGLAVIRQLRRRSLAM